MENVMSPRDSALFITDNAEHVFVNTEGVNFVADLILQKVKEKTFNVKMWKEHELNPKTSDESSIDWVFLIDLLNFSFWSPDNNKFVVSFNKKHYTGYWALCAAINRALEAGYKITDPNHFAAISRQDLFDIFRSDSDIQMSMMEERLQLLHEAGRTLLDKYGGSFVICIKECGKSAQRLLQVILRDFPSFRDTAMYKGKKVSFYKRAQILIADVWSVCEGQGLGEFTDIDTLTMFADYRIPQALVFFKAMSYSEHLHRVLEQGMLMSSGDPLEVEIRGVSIWITELIKDAVVKELNVVENMMVNSILIDYYLWDYRQRHAEEINHVLFHMVRSVYY